MIGNHNIRNLVDQICLNADVYRTRAAFPANILLAMDAGDGRKTVMNFIADAFKENDIITFSEFHDVLEVSPDSTIRGVSEALRMIGSEAVFSNSFEGVVGIDVEKLRLYTDEPYVMEFLERLKNMSGTFFIFFLSKKHFHEMNSRKMVQKLRAVWPDLNVLEAEEDYLIPE